MDISSPGRSIRDPRRTPLQAQGRHKMWKLMEPNEMSPGMSIQMV